VLAPIIDPLLTATSEMEVQPWFVIRTETTAKSCAAPVSVAASDPVAIFPKQACLMTFPVYAYWKSWVYPDIAISVAPGLSFVQKCRIRSPAVIPEGILSTALVASSPTVVICDERVG
jgi:hypothetical protein